MGSSMQLQFQDQRYTKISAVADIIAETVDAATDSPTLKKVQKWVEHSSCQKIS